MSALLQETLTGLFICLLIIMDFDKINKIKIKNKKIQTSV